MEIERQQAEVTREEHVALNALNPGNLYSKARFLSLKIVLRFFSRNLLKVLALYAALVFHAFAQEKVSEGCTFLFVPVIFSSTDDAGDFHNVTNTTDETEAFVIAEGDAFDASKELAYENWGLTMSTLLASSFLSALGAFLGSIFLKRININVSTGSLSAASMATLHVCLSFLVYNKLIQPA